MFAKGYLGPLIVYVFRHLGFQSSSFDFGISFILCEYYKRQKKSAWYFFLNLCHEMYARFKYRILQVLFILPPARSCEDNPTDVHIYISQRHISLL